MAENNKESTNKDVKAAKKEEKAAKKQERAAKAAAKETPGSTAAKKEGTIPAIGRGIAATVGFFSRRIRNLLGGLWDASAGQVTGEAKEVATRLGYENQEAGPLNSIAAITEGITSKIGNLLGKVAGEPIIYAGKGVKGVLSYAGSLIGRVPGRILRGIQRSIYGVIMGKEVPTAA